MFPWRLPTWLNGYCAGGCAFWKKFLMLFNVHFDVFNGSTFEIELGAFLKLIPSYWTGTNELLLLLYKNRLFKEVDAR
jgi:hypothetical protein